MFKFIRLLCFITILICFARAKEAPKTYTMHISHFMPRNSHVNKDFLVPWAKKIEKESNGRLTVKIHPAMSLGGSPVQLVEQARSGAVSAIWTVLGYTPGQFPKTEVFELPLISSSTKSVVSSMAINDYYHSHLQEEFKDFYVVLLHSHAAGGFHLKKKINNISDLGGLKIRTPNKTIGNFLTNLGASPIVMPVSEVYEGLNYGMLDGAMLPYEVVVPFRLFEKASHHIDGPFYTTVFGFLMNKDFYNSLPKDLQEIVDNNSKSNIAYDTALIFDNIDNKLREKVLNIGDSINFLSQEELSKADNAVGIVTKEWIKNNSKELYDDAVRSLRKYEKIHDK